MAMAVADLIFAGGTIVTMEESMPEAAAMAIKDGRILAVGSKDDIEAYRGSKSRIIDLEGRTLMPGFIEPHGHPLFTAFAWGEPVVDIRAVHTRTYGAALEKIRRRVAKARKSEVLYFLGLDPQLHVGMEQPSLKLLDEIAPDNPIVVQTSNFHAIYLNTRARELYDIPDDIPDPEGGKIERDASGKPWKFVERAAKAIARKFYDHCGAERGETELQKWVWKFAAAGITTSTEIGMQPGWLPFYEALYRRSDVPIRIRGYEAAVLSGTSSQPLDNGDDLFSMVGMKFWADGSPFVGNIATSRPYLNTEVTLNRMGLPRDHLGHLNYEREQIEQLVDIYASQGWQLAVHSQGDRAIDVMLDCYERALAKYPNARRPFRLEHCALMRDDQIDRANRLGVVCSYFLPHIYYWGESLRDALFGEEVAARYMPAGSAARAGMRMSYHCDSPMTDPNPLLCLELAVTRRTRLGAVLGSDQRVSVERALRAITIDAAYQIRMDKEIGSLSPGKFADLVVLATDPRKCAPEKLSSIEVMATYLGGEQRWGSPSSKDA
jgi:predicted amidohydrolase YtcJ